MIQAALELRNKAAWDRMPTALARDFPFLAAKSVNSFFFFSKKRVKEVMGRTFILRRSRYANLTVIDKATKIDLSARITHMSTSVKKHEDATRFVGKNRFVPESARPSKFASIRKAKSPSNLLKNKSKHFVVWDEGEAEGLGAGIYERKGDRLEQVWTITKEVKYPFRFSMSKMLERLALARLPRHFAVSIGREMRRRGYSISSI